MFRVSHTFTKTQSPVLNPIISGALRPPPQHSVLHRPPHNFSHEIFTNRIPPSQPLKRIPATSVGEKIVPRTTAKTHTAPASSLTELTPPPAPPRALPPGRSLRQLGKEPGPPPPPGRAGISAHATHPLGLVTPAHLVLSRSSQQPLRAASGASGLSRPRV